MGLTKAAAVELGPYQINVNGVAPGFVRTELVSAVPPQLLELYSLFSQDLAQLKP